MTRRPNLLPLLPASSGPHGSRSAMTCHYRCGDACSQPVPNTSANPEFHTVAEQALGRRALLGAGAAGAAALAVSGLVAEPAAASPRRPAGGRPVDHRVSRAAFTAVPPNTDDRVTVPRGFRSDVVIRWGDPVEPGAPAFDVHAQTAAAQRKQFGYNNDYVGLLPLGRGEQLLVVNHEYTNENLMFPTGTDPELVKEVAMAAHGMSVVQLRRGGRPGSWTPVPVRKARLNRRIHLDTRFALTGPAAGDPRLRTSADPKGRTVRGTLNNCAGGLTPWGTVLSGEENFNQYFEGEPDPAYATSYARYGINGGSTRGWATVDPRFDLAREPHEPFRFGWVVEVDPYDPRSTPRKHTMLGRFKHEGANVTVARSGHVVAYMGDDERGDYIYKFVSAKRMAKGRSRAARRHNLTLLTEGTLYVARFTGDGLDDDTFDGTGSWIPLTSDKRSYVDGFSVADVLIDTRLAADQVGPTRMDRPEDIEPNPVNGRVYCALTNNSNRGTTHPADEANPVTSSMVRGSLDAPLTPASGNRNGYVLELAEQGDDPRALRFRWNLLLVCGDPEAPETYFGGFPKEKVSPISCPDNVAFDSQGNLWVSTDGNVLGSHDGLFRVPVAGRSRGKVEQFLTVPVAAETCGPFITRDDRTVFVAVQHPGEADGATFESQASTWPHTDPFPRPSVVAAYRG
ncbi:PhoX family protein [Nocardioides caldifontis]|uniref:PhoX family protein n=1 Tax=Nocardioides caldifontis TaxID=2588938 RepID=UPI0011DFAAF9|nr:PhoX family phosphatase [Nocardioides caldifontis]